MRGQVAAIATAALLLVACTSRGTDTAGQSPAFPVEQASVMLQAICDIESMGVPSERAAATFFGMAHLPLHELAATTQPLDRELTARLLEAKAAVEGPLEIGKAPDGFVRRVRSLRVAAADAISLAGVELETRCRT